MRNKTIIIEIIDELTGIKKRGEMKLNQMERTYSLFDIDPLRLIFNKLLTEVNKEIAVRTLNKLNPDDMKLQTTFYEGINQSPGEISCRRYADKHLSIRFFPTETKLYKRDTYIKDIKSLDDLQQTYEILTNNKFKKYGN